MNKQLKQEEENLKKGNEDKIILKEKDLNNKIERLKKDNILILEKKKREYEKLKQNFEKGNEKKSNKQIEDLLFLLNKQNNIKDEIDRLKNQNEQLKIFIEEKKKEKDIENGLLLKKQKEYEEDKKNYQSIINNKKNEWVKERNRILEMERNLKKKEIQFREEQEKKKIIKNYKQKEN